MNIVIISDFCGDFHYIGKNRFLYLANMLCKEHKVELITSDFNHGTKKKFEYVPNKSDYKITMLHEPFYPQNICLKRFYSHYRWGKEVAKYLRTREKPDVVYCAVPILTAANEAAKYCKKNNVRFIIDIQDLWPEAFKMVFHLPAVSNIIFFPFSALANQIYKAADEVIAVSETYVKRALKVNHKCKEGHSVFLGMELKTFDKNVKNNPVERKDKDKLWLGYCGTLGSSYDLICVIDALAIIKERGFRAPKFMVYGDGPKRKEFEEYSVRKNVDVLFMGRLPYDKMCGNLIICDMAVNPIVKKASQSIINKHSDYAACGLAVLNTQENSEYRKLVNIYKMGLNVKNNDAKDLADKMIKLMCNPDMRNQMGINARKCAEECFDREKTYNELIKLVED